MSSRSGAPNFCTSGLLLDSFALVYILGSEVADGTASRLEVVKGNTWEVIDRISAASLQEEPLKAAFHPFENLDCHDPNILGS